MKWGLFNKKQTNDPADLYAKEYMCSLPKWESIQYIIEFYVNKTDSNIHHLGGSRFTNWLANFNRTFDVPTRTQVESLKKILAQCGCDLEKSEKMQIEFCIKGF